MLSIELIRKNPRDIEQQLARRGEDARIEQICALDERRRSSITVRDRFRAQRNQLSQRFGELRKQAMGDRANSAMENRLRQEIQAVNKQMESSDRVTSELDSQLHDLLLALPNIPSPDVPDGLDESGNQIVRTWGEPKSFSFPPKPHWELGEDLKIIDWTRGAKLSGSRFFVLFGAGAQMERALVNWMLDLHVARHGYTEVYPPALVREEIMTGSGNLPKFGDNLYRDAEDDLWLIPTAEVPLTNLHRDEILELNDLPRHYVSCTPCFRREKAAAGRDTRGIKRVHQFNKVELYKFVEPETSSRELDLLVSNAEEVCRGLGLTYRVLKLCAGDLGFPSAITYDIEVWAPGSGEWLEVSSCSNCTDFQARRSNVRFRPKPGATLEFPHTINGSGLALPRTLIAIMETYQRADGSIELPEVLLPYLGFRVVGGD